MNLNSMVKQGDDPLSAEVDGELIMMSIEQGNYYGLGETGSRIWKLMETPIRVSDLCATLCQEYDVAPSVCEADTLDFLEKLAEQGLIEASSPGE